MLRFLTRFGLASIAIALTHLSASAQEQTKPVDLTISGQIVESDAKDTARQMPCKIHVIKLGQGRTYIIEMVSADLDAYLRLEDSAGAQVAQNDDGGGGRNARIRYSPTKDDAFKIIATSFAGGEGNYTLTVKDTNAPVAAGRRPLPIKEGPKQIFAPKKVEEAKQVENVKEPGPKPQPEGTIKLDTPTKDKATDLQGQLKDNDPIDPTRNHPAKNFAIELNEGSVYTIELKSADFDSFLRVLDSDGKELAQDDDSGGNLDARVVFVPPAKGAYRIVATSFDGGVGNFQLTINPTKDFGKSIKYDPEKVHDGATNFFIASKLTNQDDKDAVQQNSPCQIHLVKLQKDKTYIVDLISGQMDCFLRIEDAQKAALAEDDDGGEGLNSRLSFTPTDDGVFRLVATNLGGGTGAYILAIRERK